MESAWPMFHQNARHTGRAGSDVPPVGPVISVHPASQTVVVGTTVVLSVTATGDDLLGYQWRKGGVELADGGNVSGADTATLTLANAAVSDTGVYDVVVSDSSGSVVSRSAVVTVNLIAAAVMLSDLDQVYDGTPKQATVTTDPPGLAVKVTYNGGSVLPAEVGSYAVVATVVEPNYAGSASGTLVIGPDSTGNDGQLDMSFDPNAGGSVYTTAVQPDGKIIVGGYFWDLGGQSRNRIARLHADGSLDAGFNPSANESVYSVVVEGAGQILLGAHFTAVGGMPRNRIARLLNGVATQTLTAPDATRVLWLRGGTAPELEAVMFDVSVDGGATWTPLGAGARVAGGWELTGLTLPSMGSLRARGRATGGLCSGSTGLIEQTVTIELPANTPPSASRPIPDQRCQYGASFALTFEPDTFTDSDAGQSLSYSASGMPVGIDFDAQTRTFGGTPGAVGVYSITLSATDNGNPPASASTTFDLEVSAAPLTVRAANQSKIYGETVVLDQTAPSDDFSIDGLLLGDTVMGVDLESAGTAATAGVGSYDIVVRGIAGEGLDNYVINCFSGLLTVYPVVAAVTLGDLDYTYDGTPKAASVLTDPPGLAIEVTYDGGSALPVKVGSYAVVATVVEPNYAGSASGILTIAAVAPVVSALNLASRPAGEGGFVLTVSGYGFQEGATVLWDGALRETTFLSAHGLEAEILEGDLLPSELIRVVVVQVSNPGGVLSAPAVFTIVGSEVERAKSDLAQPGEIVTVSTAPVEAGDPGVAALVQNSSGEPVVVVAANYSDDPVGETVFNVSEGEFVDLQITGADSQDVAAVYFYYPSTVTGTEEENLTLLYFDGVDWVPVLSKGGESPEKDTADNLEGTVSGGRFTVVFDDTSTPRITELGGTVFCLFDSRPQVRSVVGPTNPVPVGTPVTVTASCAALGGSAAATIIFDWSDGTVTEVTPAVDGFASATHWYAASSVYAVHVRLTDRYGQASEASFEYVVIYDPNGGFVTGGGWINSPPGAFYPVLQEFAGVTGKATFGFVAKYLKGANVPSGNTEFQFKAGNFNFRSTAYQWLIVAGARAQYKGWGTINGEGDYAFMLTAIDGALLGGDAVDRFRIKIWDQASGIVIYDNQAATGDTAGLTTPGTVLGGGNIVIHRP